MTKRRFTGLILGAIAACSSITTSQARGSGAPFAAAPITAHRALALCGRSHLRFHATVQGFVRTGSFTRQSSFSAGLFDSNRVPQSAGAGMQFTRYHGVRLLVPYKVVRRKPSILVSGTRLTVYGVVVCAQARTTVNVQQIISARH